MGPLHFNQLHKLQVNQAELFMLTINNVMYAAINYEFYMLIIQPSN